MIKYKIGNLVSLKNHPFILSPKTKIGANAFMTPPIMVVTEIFDNNKTNLNFKANENLSTQVLCTFYNSKNSCYEKHWFKIDEITGINQDEVLQENIAEDYLSLRTIFKNNIVVLRSADVELGKKKISWTKDVEDEKFRTESYLDFLPPVMTVIDVVENKKYLKKKKLAEEKNTEFLDKYLLKCRWFNPTKQTFSEDLISYKIVEKVLIDLKKIEIIKNGINNENLFKIPKQVQLEASKKTTFNFTIVEVKDIILLNHRVKILYKDLLLNKTESSFLEEIDIINSNFRFEDLIDEKYPDYSSRSYNNINNLQWNINNFYKINYIDKKGRFTSRIITNCEKTEFDNENGEQEVFIIANCLLRNGHIRHFKLKNIGERLVLKKEFETLIN